MFTVVLLGTGFVAILSAIFTSTNISDKNQQRTRASIAVQAQAEALLQPAIDPPANPPPSYYPQQSYTYKPCAAWSGAYDLIQSSSGLLPTGYTATITKIRYFTGTFNASGPVFTNASWDEGTATSYCYGNYYTSKRVKTISGGEDTIWVDRGMQEITVRLDSGPRRDRVIDTLVIVKRDQRCPGTYDNADLGPC
ncbi:MAG: hypothetical protein KF703_13025 [Actinobacteria bacterium]|nr:hypothetical protein [Actinomycetota bacterium]